MSFVKRRVIMWHVLLTYFLFQQMNRGVILNYPIITFNLTVVIFVNHLHYPLCSIL